VPDVNISIDNPVAVVDKNVDKHGNREVAEAFVKFLYTPEAQREFAKVGFRPVDPTVEKEVESQFPKVKTLFTVQDLGGWDKSKRNSSMTVLSSTKFKPKLRNHLWLLAVSD
jgi:ABC-type sulfate transport system substrate-binding protein